MNDRFPELLISALKAEIVSLKHDLAHSVIESRYQVGLMQGKIQSLEWALQSAVELLKELDV